MIDVSQGPKYTPETTTFEKDLVLRICQNFFPKPAAEIPCKYIETLLRRGKQKRAF